MQASWGDVIFAPVANCTACPRKPKLIPGNTATKTTIKTFYVNTGRPRDPNGKSFQNIRSVRQVSGCFALRLFFVAWWSMNISLKLC